MKKFEAVLDEYTKTTQELRSRKQKFNRLAPKISDSYNQIFKGMQSMVDETFESKTDNHHSIFITFKDSISSAPWIFKISLQENGDILAKVINPHDEERKIIKPIAFTEFLKEENSCEILAWLLENYLEFKKVPKPQSAQEQANYFH